MDQSPAVSDKSIPNPGLDHRADKFPEMSVEGQPQPVAFRGAWEEPASAPIRQPSARAASPIHLIKKLADVMTDLNWVEKRGHNSHFGYDYATEADILAAVRPRLAEKGVFVQTLLSKEEKVPTGKQEGQQAKKDVFLWRVETLHIFHDSGSGETMDVIGIGYSEDSSDKGFAKAYTAAVKFMFSKQFMISTGDDPEQEGSADKAAAKKAAAKNQPAGATGGPQRTGGVQIGEDGVFTVTSTIEVFEQGPNRAGGTSYKFLIPNVGKASTIDSAIAQSLIKEKGTGMMVRFKLQKNGSWLNILAAQVIPPDSVEG